MQKYKSTPILPVEFVQLFSLNLGLAFASTDRSAKKPESLPAPADVTSNADVMSNVKVKIAKRLRSNDDGDDKFHLKMPKLSTSDKIEEVVGLGNVAASNDEIDVSNVDFRLKKRQSSVNSDDKTDGKDASDRKVCF